MQTPLSLTIEARLLLISCSINLGIFTVAHKDVLQVGEFREARRTKHLADVVNELEEYETVVDVLQNVNR